jgi:hypothetical protein
VSSGHDLAFFCFCITVAKINGFNLDFMKTFYRLIILILFNCITIYIIYIYICIHTNLKQLLIFLQTDAVHCIQHTGSLPDHGVGGFWASMSGYLSLPVLPEKLERHFPQKEASMWASNVLHKTFFGNTQATGLYKSLIGACRIVQISIAVMYF